MVFDINYFRYRQCVHQSPVPGPQFWPETADCVRGRWPQSWGEDGQDPGGGAGQSGPRGAALCHWEVGPGQCPVSPGDALLWLPPVDPGYWIPEVWPLKMKNDEPFTSIDQLSSERVKTLVNNFKVPASANFVQWFVKFGRNVFCYDDDAFINLQEIIPFNVDARYSILI